MREDLVVSISSFQNRHTTAPLCSLLDGGEREGQEIVSGDGGGRERERKKERKKERWVEI